MKYPTVQPTPAQKQTDGMMDKAKTMAQAASGKESGQNQPSEKLLNASRSNIEGNPTTSKGVMTSYVSASTTPATSRHNEASAE